jgi:spore coat protein U-like protein
MSKRLSSVFLAALLVGACGGARAACNVSGVDVRFGTYDPLAIGATPTTGSITVTCDQAPPPTVTIQIGPSAGTGAFAPRGLRKVGGTEILGYNLYADSNLTQIWGDGTAGTVAPTNRVRKNAPWSPTVYARIPAGQDVSAGAYTDVLSITIQF